MFKVGKDESQIDKHTFSRNICSIWLLFLAPLAAHGRFFWYQNSKASPPPKKKTHKLIVPCAEVWEKWLKVLIWDRDAVYWTFWRDLSIQGSLILKHTHGCAILNVIFASKILIDKSYAEVKKQLQPCNISIVPVRSLTWTMCRSVIPKLFKKPFSIRYG